MNNFFKSIFEITVVGSLATLYWNYYIVSKLGIGKLIENSDISIFIVGFFILNIIYTFLSGKYENSYSNSNKFSWVELILLWLGGLLLIFLFK